MAEILALLPNGTYRALVAQREITLALPFSAKPGDSLELEVAESEGKLSLAFIANRSAGSENSGLGRDSVATTLSQTGKLIGDLLGNIDNQGKRASPAPLNGNQPLIAETPVTGADLAPVLKDALSKSGVFYEAHQARWIAGQLPTEQLLSEPQGRHSQLPPSANPMMGDASNNRNLNAQRDASLSPAVSTEQTLASKAQPGGIPAELGPLVQQQLDALATQTFAWQGQIWPGQQMAWEIDERQSSQNSAKDEAGGQWQTRLKLTLPHLGGIEATLRLRPGNDVEISLATDSAHSEGTLGAAGAQLQAQFEAAGLNLTQLMIKHGSPTER